MLFTKTNTAKIESASASERARAAGLAAQAAAQNAAQSAAAAARTAAMAAQATAQNAASGVSSGVQQGVYSARRWTAPQLEIAAVGTVLELPAAHVHLHIAVEVAENLVGDFARQPR